MFYRSQHHLFRFIFGREQPTSEDTRLLVEIAIERLAHYTHLHQGCPALADKHFSADHRAQLLSLLFSNDESVFLLQCYHDRACDVVDPLNPDALSATWIQSSKGQLLQFFVHSKDVGQCLTKAKYVKACHEDQWLFAQAALARLQYGALVDAVHYSPQQLAEYLRIVISANLNLLAENCSFTTAAEKMINCYCFGADEGSAFFNNIEQIKKEKQFCRVEVVPTIDEYLQCDDAGRRQQLCEAGLGGWAIKFITDYVTGQRQYLQQAQMLPSPKDRASVIKAIVSEDFWVEKVCLAHPQMCVIIAIIKSYLATPSFQGDTLAIEALLNHFTPDGYYDHRFIMYKNAVERRFSGEAVDFIAHQPDIKEDKVEGSWQFEGPNVITSFLAKNHFDQGSVERKLLFLKAMVCLCERVSCSPDASYIELMYEAASDAMLIQRLQQESDLLPRMTGILTKAGKEITAHIVESQSVDFEYSDEWAPEGHAGVTLFSRASEPPPGLGGASADYKM